MSLEQYFDGAGSAEFLNIFSVCLASVGTEDFNSNFLGLIENVINADQCMIFSYKNDRPECYLSYNERTRRSAENLAQTYLRDGFKSDPLLSDLVEVRKTGATRIVGLSELKPRMSDGYFKCINSNLI